MSTTDHIEFQAQINKRQNPFIERVQGKKFKWKKTLFWTGSVLVALLIILEIAFFRNSNYYPRLAVFTGNAHVSDQILAQELNRLVKGSRTLGLIPKKHMLFLPKGQIQKSFFDRFGMTNVSIDAILGQRTIHITVHEAPIVYRLQRNNELLNVTQDGHILVSGIQVSQNNEPPTTYDGITIVFTDQTQTILSLVQIPKGIMDKLRLIDAIAKEIQNSVIITKIQLINESSNDAQLTTSKGWYIRIDMTEDITTQVKNAQKVFAEKIKGTSKESSLQYIDARILDRVYYK